MNTSIVAPAPQLTARAIILSVVLAVILAAANTYLGLFAGMTIASAIPAAVVSMAVLRALGGGGILENNIVQTGASAGTSIASGVIFTVPALVLMGYWPDFKYWWVLAIAGLGGLLGVLFSVPLRRSLIVDQQMAFPEGKAAAEVLRAGANPSHGIRILGISALAGGIGKVIAASGLRFIPDSALASGFIGKFLGYMGTNISPALLGVGYIVGLNIGVVVVSGSILSYNIAIPIFHAYFLPQNPELAAAIAGACQGLSNADCAEVSAQMLRSAQIRYLGVGAMLVGGLWALISLRHSIVSGVKSGLAATRAGTDALVAHTDRDLPMKWVLVGIVVFTIPLAVLYTSIVGSVGVGAAMSVIMVVAGFLFCSVSAYMAGLVGSSNNPVSGITIATILFAALVLLGFLGRDSAIGPVAAVMIGAVVCCAACVAGDNLQDLKAGYMVGATPWKQQLMLAIGSVSCALVMAPVLNMLAHSYGIGPRSAAHPLSLEAAQANLMASVAKGLFGGHLPWGMIAIGAVIGVAVIILDQLLKARGARFRVPVLAAAIGIYLPLETMVPIFLGGLLNHLVTRSFGRGLSDEKIERRNQTGTLFAAGLITGEALMGIAIGAAIYKTDNPEVFALPAGMQLGGSLGEWVGLAILGAIGYWMYRVGKRTPASA
ncbi:MAG TPA: oligopeptide transporter, OPT family [Steroidobacteraceae bacterium]|jgi:putative OPT family oligopeptide transporter|nr:oligopeptide transporter, OPT family [Steroidobacteraceae bacterium]